MKTMPAVWLAGLFLAVVSSASAQENFENDIVGKWEVNVAKTSAYLKERNQPTLADEDFLKQLGAIAVEFGADHSIQVRENANEQMKGEWKFVKEEDALFHIELIRDEEATPTTIEFLDRDSIVIIPKNETALVLSRAGSQTMNGLVAKIVGTWKRDRDATVALESNKSFSQDQLTEMLAETDNMMLTFNADNSAAASFTKDEENVELKGTWTVTNVDEAKKTFQITFSHEEVKREVHVTFLDDGKVCLNPEGKPGAVFTREPEKTDK